MKDGFKSITIEPFNGYLDFQGPINAHQSTGNMVLKGDIHLELIKAVNVKKATLKFIGCSRVCHHNTLDRVDISTPILPKLKTHLFSSTTTLGPGEVILPWEMEILNIYPCSVMIKRVTISYKIELTISLGLNRTVSAEYPIVLKRHMLPCLEVAPLVPTKLYTKTISTKFHYEINAPRIVCISQKNIALAVKLLTIGTQKRVLSIRTQVIQVELCRCNTLPKTDADMTKFKSRQSPSSGKKSESNKYAKYSKRTTPAIIHTLDETQALSSNRPLLLRHPLGEYLTLGMESPLACIYHQLEITFQFGAKFEDIRAKVPIMIVSAGPSLPPINSRTTTSKQQPEPIPLALYPFEKMPVTEPLLVMDETRIDRNFSKYTTNSTNITTIAPNYRAPTPSSTSSDVATTMEEDEEDDEEEGMHDLTEMVAGHPTANDSSISDTVPTDLNTLPLQLRRTRSALNISTTTPTSYIPKEYAQEKEEATKHHMLQLPHQQGRHERQQQSIASLQNRSTSTTPINDLPPSQQRQASGTTLNIPLGMWPRPGTQVPAQWRRRSTSQPFLPTTNTIADSSPPPPPRPLKDAKRNLNLTITPPSIITTGKSTLQHVAEATQRIPMHDRQRQNDVAGTDGSLLGASESSASFSSSASSSSSSSSYIDSSSNSSSYEPHSRPNSPTFAPAPGLPSSISLRPQTATPVALLEESFVLSPGGSLASTPIASHHHHHRGFSQGSRRTASDLRSVTSSVLDPDEDIMAMMHTMEIQYRREQQQSLEHHYTYADLPSLPTPTTVSYADNDSSSDDDDDDDGESRMHDDDADTIENGDYPPIAASPLPPLPPDQQEPVCLCPKHGVVVTRR